MKASWSGMGRALGTALIWAVACAIAALLLSLIVDADGAMEEIWPAIGAYPGFIAGLIFFAALRIARGRSGFEPSSPARSAAWGAPLGLLVGVLPFEVASNSELPSWLVAVLAFGLMTLASAAAAAGSALLVRNAAQQKTLSNAGPTG